MYVWSVSGISEILKSNIIRIKKIWLNNNIQNLLINIIGYNSFANDGKRQKDDVLWYIYW